MKGDYILPKASVHLMYICLLIICMYLELNGEQFSESKYSTFEKPNDDFVLFMIKYFNGNKYLAVSL